ncbi:hypothetical protein QRE63_28700 (plasmid) [Bacillus mycoides]|nr:hypothetical protein QRE63_28700 [Bacillus mycoides]
MVFILLLIDFINHLIYQNVIQTERSDRALQDKDFISNKEEKQRKDD